MSTAITVKPLTGGDAYRLVEEVVTESGQDHTCESPGSMGPRYAHAGQPVCLVGRALHRHGWSVEQIAALDEAVSPDIHLIRDDLLAHPITPEAREILRAAQEVQDQLTPWSGALAAARTAAVRLGAVDAH